MIKWQPINISFTPTLSKNEVHLWCQILPTEETPQNEESILSLEEKSRANAFYFPKDRHRFVSAHIKLRCLLAKYLEIDPAEICFVHNRHGKPVIHAAQNLKHLTFNISHSHQCVLYAFARNQEIGVDVEYMKEGVDYDSLSRRFFAENEYQAIHRIQQQKNRLFYTIWSCKEAFVKATGLGLSYSLKDFEVSAEWDQPVKLVHISSDTENVEDWCLFSFEPVAGYMGALAVKGKVRRVSGYKIV